MSAPVTDAERLIEDAQRWSHAAPRWPTGKDVLDFSTHRWQDRIMKKTHFLTETRESAGYKTAHYTRRATTRAIGLCGTWTTPRKATTEPAKVTCLDCKKRMAS